VDKAAEFIGSVIGLGIFVIGFLVIVALILALTVKSIQNILGF
jgi:hypothetical protein